MFVFVWCPMTNINLVEVQDRESILINQFQSELEFELLYDLWISICFHCQAPLGSLCTLYQRWSKVAICTILSDRNWSCNEITRSSIEQADCCCYNSHWHSRLWTWKHTIIEGYLASKSNDALLRSLADCIEIIEGWLQWEYTSTTCVVSVWCRGTITSFFHSDRGLCQGWQFWKHRGKDLRSLHLLISET